MSNPARAALWTAFAAAALLGPFVVYPILLMDVFCFALFACGFNLLLGFSGLLSFGHAAFFATGAYAGGYAMKVWALCKCGWLCSRQPGHTPSGNLFRHDHASAGADDLFFPVAGAVYRG
jgi:ABC-type branched-subunit amino acid transport system permease subunit